MKRRIIVIILIITLMVSANTFAFAQPDDRQYWLTDEQNTETHENGLHAESCDGQGCIDSHHEESLIEALEPTELGQLHDTNIAPKNELTPQQSPIELNYIEPDDLPDEVTDDELMFVARLLDRTPDDISQYGIVYDAADRPLFLVVEFASGGFMLMLRTLQIPWEYSRTSAGSPYSGQFESKMLYLGLLSPGSYV